LLNFLESERVVSAENFDVSFVKKIPKNKRVMTEISWKLITFSLTEWWPF
jgi:hypothetical protein